MSSSNSLPSGTFNHGDPNQICVPSKWTDIVVFFLGNYVAHAATTVLLPGSSIWDSASNVIFALLFPVTGINRGLRSLFSFAIVYGLISGSDLQMAARAGALCKVIRKGEHAQTAREVSLTNSVKAAEVPFLRKLFVGKVHGRIRLPEGYGLAIVSRNAKFVNDKSPSTIISSNYSFVKALVAVVQLVFSSLTLYRSSGPEIGQYGYAAFGLTVAQYALMSLINLLATLLVPQYPAMYLVETEVMRECQQQPDAVFEGIVGILKENLEDLERDRMAPTLPDKYGFGWLLLDLSKRSWWAPIAWTPTAVSLCIIWALSRFRPASSTPTQRGVLMLWLALGSYTGVLGYDHAISENRRNRRVTLINRIVSIALVIYIHVLTVGPVVWGFIIVGEMLKEYGSCSQL